MKVFRRTIFEFTFLIGLLFLMTGIARSQSVPFAAGLYYPTNNQIFGAPANIYVHASVTDSNVVRTVQYFSGATSIGLVTNSSGLLFTNTTAGNPFYIIWSNVTAGAYSLTAVVVDSTGNTATSAPVNISVTNPVVHPAVYIYSPTNGATFLTPANLTLYARAVESSGTVATVQFFANNASLGVVSNSSQTVYTNVSTEPLYALSWSNVLAGNYALKAVATDVNGNTATSSVVTINVVTNITPPVVHPSVAIYSPASGTKYVAPASVNIYARAVENPGTVAAVQFFANSINLGVVSNSSQMTVSNISSVPLFPLTWSNAPVGTYDLRAVATDTNGNSATSSVVSVSIVTNTPPPVVPFAISFWYPTNGQTFAAPANIGVHAIVVDSNIVRTVQYFANGGGIGTVTNSGGIFLTSMTQENPFFLSWSNVPAGSYTLIAVATDSAANTATSSPVNITVTNIPPPVIHPSVAIYSPANGTTYHAPTNVNIYARAVESTGMVAAVEFFANNVSLGVVSNTSLIIVSNISTAYLFPLTWSNVPVGNFELKAIATDTNGNMATSSVVVISVLTNSPPPNVPFTVAFWYPTNGQWFVAPANVGVHARVTDSNLVQTVQYFANGSIIGIVTNIGGVLLTNSTQANSFFLDWSNVPAGIYALTAMATDSTGNTATSAPVNIYVVTNPPPVINIYATDPVAIEGTNYLNCYHPGSTASNYVSGENTATFLVHRDGSTNADLTVYYSIGGTAINGEDYETLPGSVTIPAGKTYALITIYPLDDSDSDYRYYDTVVLSLIAPPTAYNSPATYSIGSPHQAGAIILEENFLPMPQPVIHAMEDSSLHISLPATNGMNYSLQISTDMINWLPISTNTVLKGSAQFVDPNGTAASSLYYRIVPVTAPAAY
jgi:Big-like domain-containing protein